MLSDGEALRRAAGKPVLDNVHLAPFRRDLQAKPFEFAIPDKLVFFGGVRGVHHALRKLLGQGPNPDC